MQLSKDLILCEQLKDILLEMKVKNIVEFNKVSIWEKVIICTCNSDIHLQAVARKLSYYVKKNKFSYYINGIKQWILLDVYDTIIHLFLEEIREYYNLEDMFKITQEAME
jgi:ribosome-associated protein